MLEAITKMSFEIASTNAADNSRERPLKKKSQEVGDVRGKKRFYRKGSPDIFSGRG
jgi:hypothetical protein